jgi:hypothetical protein
MTMGGAFGVEREDGTSSFGGQGMLAQDPGSHAGKLLRLRDDGSVPPDNPFVGSEGYKPEIYSLGHRNQQGLTLHPETGMPGATEHASQGGDELNAILPGRNWRRDLQGGSSATPSRNGPWSSTAVGSWSPTTPDRVPNSAFVLPCQSVSGRVTTA